MNPDTPVLKSREASELQGILNESNLTAMLDFFNIQLR